MRARLGFVALLACGILLLASGAFAQGGGGGLSGQVKDNSGNAVAGVAITVTNTATGFTRTTATGADGRYNFASLPAGSYDLKAEAQGMRTVEQKNLGVVIATSRNNDLTMELSAVEESIVVTAEEVPLLPDSPAVGTVVSQKELESLPLNGRQFANLAVLAPGTQLAYNSDPTKPGQLTVALNGGIGRNVNFTVDGGDNTDDTIGGALQNFNLESVQEFKIQTMMYKAEYGRSSGGVLSVVTKTGSNQFSGSAWEFARRKSLNSETESENLAGIGKQPYKRDQYGASIGGPIVKDKAHFFATYEKTKRNTAYTVNTDGVLPIDGTSVSLPFTDELATAKATWDLSASQFLQVRYGYQKNADKYGASALAAPDALGTVSNKYSSALIGHTWQIGASAINDALFQYTKFDNLISADSNNPTVYFPSGVHTGQNINTPQSTRQKKEQFKDDFSWSQDFHFRNDFKVGAQYVNEPTLGGDFTVGTNGQFLHLTDDVNSPITDITYFGGFSGNETPIKQYSGYLQDDLYPIDRLTVSVGLRYDYWKGFDLDQRSNPIWQELATQTTYSEPYLQDFRGGKGGVLSNDDNNWAPRLGFMYDLRGDGRMLLRGGYGTYYDFPYTNATILFPASAVQSVYGVVYNVNDSHGIRNPDGSFFQIGQPLPPNALPGADIPPPNEVASPTLATPYSDQMSLGWAYQVTSELGVDISLVSIDYHDIPFRFRANPVDPATGDRRFSDFANFRLWYGNGRAKYDAANFGVRWRAPKVDLQGFYTYGKADGNVLAGADEFRLTDRGYQPGLARDVSVNPLDPLCGACFGPLNTDARHKLTLGGTFTLPWEINLSTMFRYRSATPYTFWAAQDLNGDGFNFDLPPGVDKVNSKRGHSFSQLDLRLSHDFRFGNTAGVELIAEMFNVFNEKNPAAFSVDHDGAGNPVGLTPNAYAGDPLQGEQRLIQVGLRAHF